MGKGRVDDVRVADAVDELVNADTGEQAFLTEEAIIGGIVELHKRAKGVS